ncbi:aspartate--tRNA ligase [Candidatus Woesearchaeota archaeon]|nr:MAG: aspartate--tRNA ligase [Candidatus Woesearchaeota archaeon]
MLRTHTCGELRRKDTGKKVTLCGWVHSRRDFGSMSFVDLRDRYGITQLVFDITKESVKKKVLSLRRESVIKADGVVRERKKGMVNKERATGEIEVAVADFEILSLADPLPIEPDDPSTTEDARLKYRFLDLRREKMQKNIATRHKVVKTVRDFFDKEGFLEIETPFLARPTPEGARDYLVPSRVHPGKFFALPQSPQQFKQLFQVSGFDRYVQVVKCFRDEDLRADRQPEFTQIDLEMSFVTEDDIFDVNERLMKEIWKKILNVSIKTPFPRLTYKEAMERYGSDKPDTRFGLELVDVTGIAEKSEFNVFKKIVSSGGLVLCLNAEGCASFSRKEVEECEKIVKVYDAKGLVSLKVGNELEGSAAKFFSDELQKELIKATRAKKGDLLLFVADNKRHVAQTSLGALRLHLGRKLKLINAKKWNFVWITEFPLLEYDEDEQRHVAVHHPFTSPKEEHIPLLDKHPEKVVARAYDLVLNGWELGGGSIRIHDRELQEKMFDALKISKEEQQKKFGHMLTAFRYGAPPHGGIAFGLDRLVAIICGENNIREVIAFPKNKYCKSLVDDAPNEADKKQLDELHISIRK